MKKILTLISILSIFSATGFSQCTSTPGPYDLEVTGTVVLPPSGPNFTFAYICAGGSLMDSTMCCTRMIHIAPGGVYEAGPSAYGFVYMKSGATFDAHGNNSFFGVAYEAGATILNYTGPMTLCPTVTFPSSSCISSGIAGNEMNEEISIYPNPCMNSIQIDRVGAKDAELYIYDINGKQVKVLTLTGGSSKVDVSSLSSGMYSYRLTDESSSSSGRFSIVR